MKRSALVGMGLPHDGFDSLSCRHIVLKKAIAFEDPGFRLEADVFEIFMCFVVFLRGDRFATVG